MQGERAKASVGKAGKRQNEADDADPQSRCVDEDDPDHKSGSESPGSSMQLDHDQ